MQNIVRVHWPKKTDSLRQKDMRVFDLFCGCGGFSQGFYDAGFEVVGAADAWGPAVSTYKAAFPDVNVFHADLSKLEVRDNIVEFCKTNQVDVIIGGPPCQGFSSLSENYHASNKYQLLNSLPYAFTDVCIRTLPKFIVMEEVSAFKSAPQMQVVCEALASSGYKVDWKVLDAYEYKSAQKRKRLIIVAHLGNGYKLPLHPEPCEERVTVAQAIQGAQWGPLVSNDVLEKIKRRAAGDPTLKGFKSTYTVLNLNEHSGTITGSCFAAGSGRFSIKSETGTIHRLSVAQAGCLQGFPVSKVYHGSGVQKAKIIGN